jgi:hypothetical protein
LSTIAELLVKIGGDNSGLKKTLSDSQSNIQTSFSASPINGFTDAVNSASGSLSGFVSKIAGITALAAGGFGLAEIANGAINAGDQIYQLSSRLGISAQEAGQLSRTLKLTGADGDTFATSIMRLDKNFTESGLSGDKTRATLSMFGVSLTDNAGRMLPLNEQLKNLSAGYKKAQEAGVQQEFLMETLGVRGLGLAKTLQEYGEAAEKASQVKSIGIDPKQMHDLKMDMELVSMQANQIGLAFTGAFTPIMKDLFPPIMSDLQQTTVFLSQNKAQIVDLTKKAVEMMAVYKSVQLMASAGNVIGMFWQKAAADAAISATTQTIAADAIATAQERAMARAVAASNKTFNKMQTDAVKTAYQVSASATEAAEVIAVKSVEITNQATAAAEAIRAKMTASFAEQAVSAEGSSAIVCNSLRAEGVAAAEAGTATVGAMTTAGSAVKNLTGLVYGLIGGWLGVAVAIGYAMDKMYEYQQAQNKKTIADTARHGHQPMWINGNMVDQDLGNYTPDTTSRNKESREGLEHLHDTEDAGRGSNITTPTYDMSSIENMKEPKKERDNSAELARKAEEAARKAEEANQRAKQLLSDLNSKIAEGQNSTYQEGMSKVADEVNRANTEATKIKTDGGDTSGIADKIAEYQKAAAAKVETTWHQAWQKVKDDAALLNAQMLGDKKAEADMEYNATLDKIEKERLAEIKALSHGKNGEVDQGAIDQANKDAGAKTQKAQIDKTNSYNGADEEAYKNQLQYAQMASTLMGASTSEVDQMKEKAYAKEKARLQDILNTQKLTTEQMLSYNQQLTEVESQQNELAAKNYSTAWGQAINTIRNQQVNYSEEMVSTWNSMTGSMESSFEKLADSGGNCVTMLEKLFQTCVTDIENMFIKMWTNKYIEQPLQALLGGTTSSSSGSSGWSSAEQAVANTYLPTSFSTSRSASGSTDQSGWSVVGEEGPELAYFGDTAHIYRANDTANMLNPSGNTASSSPNVAVSVINKTGQQVNVSQQANFDPSLNRTVINMIMDGVQNNTGGLRDMLYGRGG